jgi:hypothetical protein
LLDSKEALVMDGGIRRLFMELFNASSSLVFRRMDEDKRNELKLLPFSTGHSTVARHTRPNTTIPCAV